jgi:hypothetical protein
MPLTSALLLLLSYFLNPRHDSSFVGYPNTTSLIPSPRWEHQSARKTSRQTNQSERQSVSGEFTAKDQPISKLLIHLSDCEYNNTISVLVGEKKQLFTVYKDIICASSKFFKAACSERWVEGKEKKVLLPEVEPKFFQSYVAWLYSGNYQLQASKDDTHTR